MKVLHFFINNKLFITILLNFHILSIMNYFIFSTHRETQCRLPTCLRSKYPHYRKRYRHLYSKVQHYRNPLLLQLYLFLWRFLKLDFPRRLRRSKKRLNQLDNLILYLYKLSLIVVL